MTKHFFALLFSTLSLGACQLDTITEEERAVLETMKLPTALPPSPGNMYADNEAAARLGQQFFFDSRFSGKLIESSEDLGPAGTAQRVACATCHNPAAGGADVRGLGGTSLASKWTGRNSPTVINATHSQWMFWDGRKDSMWSQALGPLENPAEHNTSRLEVVHTMFAHYRDAYEAVFGPMPPMEQLARFPREGKPGMSSWGSMNLEDQLAVNRAYANFGKAIEAYERKLVDGSSPFDRWLSGDATAMSEAAVRGAKLFVGRAACNECHSGPMLADNKFHNHGVPQTGGKVPVLDTGRFGGVEKLLADEFTLGSDFADEVRNNVHAGLMPSNDDLGAFKTPTLRNVGKTGPYMHTGEFTSLWNVVLWYNDAAGTDGFVGKREAASVVPLKLTREDINDLVEFMRALDGDPLPSDLTRAPQLP